MPLYIVNVEGFGDIDKRADTIQEARDWARTAFPKHPTQVTRRGNYRHCPNCASAPCCCSPSPAMRDAMPKKQRPQRLLPKGLIVPPALPAPAPRPPRCADCGQPGQLTGHQECPYPKDHVDALDIDATPPSFSDY